ncbi:glycosyltransferase [Rosistilla oblonga]|uniref:glycosyltransferase n=1 Tax=Rosistilla oblonga TaxID=2527990 RepID=UPI003A97847F
MSDVGSGFRVALVTPDWIGGKAWNWCESWIHAFRDLGIDHKAYHVKNDERSVRDFFAGLKQQTFSHVLLSGGDQHLSFLHDADWKKDCWAALDASTICVCMERIVDSPFPDSLLKTQSAIQAFDAFVYVDEFADSLFSSAGKPSKWTTQFADHTLFRSRRPFILRKSKLYFRAQLSNFGIEGVYDERRRLIEAVRDQPMFQINGKLLSPHRYARELGKQRFVLRAPSNCPGWVDNFWNAIASGCVVFHHALPVDEVRSNRILIPETHYLSYDINDPDALCRRAVEVAKNWKDYVHVGEAARQLFLSHHTVRHFIRDTMAFAAEVL